MGADVINALVPFGVAGLAIVGIVVIAMRPKGPANWLIGMAMLLIAGIFALNLLWDRSAQATPPLVSGVSEGAFWFDAGAKADWGGRDLAHTAGDRPVYVSSRGATLCDGSKAGNIAVCWDNRGGGQAPSLNDNNVPSNETKWCTYKDSSIRISTPPDGRAQPGQIFICARFVPRN